MEDKNFITKILDYVRSLEGTIEYKTPSYIGFKINSKLYAEVHINSKSNYICVNSKFISDNDKNNVNVEVVPESYKWTLDLKVKIDENSKQDDYFDIFRRCYEGTKSEYEEKLRVLLYKAIEENGEYIKPYIEMEHYAFENKWKEFISFNISNNSLDELKSDIESLNAFSSGDVLSKYKNEEDKYNFLTLLYEVVAYADKNGYNKNIYNQYEDKRTLALTFVRQNEWVKGMLSKILFLMGVNMNIYPKILTEVL